jgi:hypothetical protein
VFVAVLLDRVLVMLVVWGVVVNGVAVVLLVKVLLTVVVCGVVVLVALVV